MSQGEPVIELDTSLGYILKAAASALHSALEAVAITRAWLDMAGQDHPGAAGEPIPVMDIPNTNHLIRTGVEDGRAVAFFADNIRVPMHPFFGTMAVAPDHPRVGQPGVRTEGLQTSGPPGSYGGNMDFRDLKAGSTLYLPVFHRGAPDLAGGIANRDVA